MTETEPQHLDCAHRCTVSDLAPDFFAGYTATDAATEPGAHGPRVVVECHREGCGKTFHLRKTEAVAPAEMVAGSAEGRLARIAEGHEKNQYAGGLTDGECAECGWPHPCPTFIWATTERDPLAPWNARDDELEEAGS